jgi:hypothetical protein
MDIGVGMVQHVVLYLPVVHVSGQNVNAASHELVHPFFIGISAVVAIVHNVHAHSGHANAHGDGQQQIGPEGQVKGQDQKIGGQKNGEHHYGFQVKFPVPGFFEIVLVEVIVDTLVQCSEKLCGILS